MERLMSHFAVLRTRLTTLGSMGEFIVCHQLLPLPLKQKF
jgi:hypothetical protein